MHACIMALQDTERYEDAISEVARVLKKNGRFIFSISHPCFELEMVKDGERISGWIYEEWTENTAEEKALHMEIKRYFGIVKYEEPWTMKRLIKHACMHPRILLSILNIADRKIIKIVRA